MKKFKKYMVLALTLALLVTSLAGISAYFTDTDTAVNTVTIGEVDIELLEPSWNGTVGVTPNATTAKDPQVENTGVNDAYVFLEVVVPYANVEVTDASGNVSGPDYTNLFSYTTNSKWELVELTSDEATGLTTAVYAYAENDNMITLTSGDTTQSLFDTITFANVVDGQRLEGMTLDVVINAYAIQTNDINGGVTAPDDVWAVIKNIDPVIGTFTKVSTEAELVAALAVGGDIRLMSDIVLTDEITFGANTTLDMNGHSISYASDGAADTLVWVNDDVEVTISNGDFIDCVVINYGTLTTNDVVIENTTEHGCGIQNEGVLTINGGAVSGEVYALFNVARTRSPIATINGGTFSGGGVSNYANANPATMTINDGVFNCNVKNVADGANVATLTITGGTFVNDPTSYLDAAKYKAVDNGNGTYTVQKFTVQVSTADELNTALANGNDIQLLSDFDTVAVPENTNIEIDMNGHAIETLTIADGANVSLTNSDTSVWSRAHNIEIGASTLTMVGYTEPWDTITITSADAKIICPDASISFVIVVATVEGFDAEQLVVDETVYALHDNAAMLSDSVYTGELAKDTEYYLGLTHNETELP